MKRVAVTAVTMVLGLLAAHCAGGADGNAPASTDTNGSHDVGDAGSPVANADAACVAHDATDDPDDDGLDTNCDGADGIVGKDIYVSGTAGADTNAGTPSAPLRTIAAATTLAGRTKGRILVASGSYEVDKLSTGDGWSLFGGYVPSFLGRPKRDASVLRAPATGLFFEGPAQASLAHVTVQGDVPSDATHRSSHGIRTRAKVLVLDDVVVAAAEAMHGGAGKPGNDGAIDTTQCASAPPSPWHAGATGDLASARAPDTGTSGTAGQTGSNGTSRIAMKDDALSLVDDAAVGGADATRGGPGGLGATGSLNNVQHAGVTYSYVYAWGGGGGVGGCPGTGGAPGQSGGVAIAMLVLDGAVTVTRSVLRTGNGGTGGDGGNGGHGGLGGYGAAPRIDSSPTVLPVSDHCAQPLDDTMSKNCAAYGGRGGDGGAGGSGGAGAGGWTMGVVIAATAAAKLDDQTSFELGRPGDGGATDRGRAPSGKAVPTTTLP